MNRAKSYVAKNMDLASALHYEGSRAGSPKKNNLNGNSVSVVHVPITNQNFQNYLVNNLEKAVYATDKHSVDVSPWVSRTQTANSNYQRADNTNLGSNSQLNAQKK